MSFRHPFFLPFVHPLYPLEIKKFQKKFFNPAPIPPLNLHFPFDTVFVSFESYLLSFGE